VRPSGRNLERTAARVPDHLALVSRHQDRRYNLRRVQRRGRRGSPGGSWPPDSRSGDRIGIWSPNCAEWVLVQYATAKVGVILVTINPAYRTSELAYVSRPVGLPDAHRRPRPSRPVTTAAMIEEVRPDLKELETVILLGSPAWGLAGGRRLLGAGQGAAGSI